jgi:hypothetical protein
LFIGTDHDTPCSGNAYGSQMADSTGFKIVGFAGQPLPS